jgi:hypothetical protein
MRLTQAAKTWGWQPGSLGSLTGIQVVSEQPGEESVGATGQMAAEFPFDSVNVRAGIESPPN